MSSASTSSPIKSDAAPTLGFWDLVRADVVGMVIDKGGSRLRYGLQVALKILLFPRIQCVLLFRLSHALYPTRLSFLAYYFQAVGLRRGGAEIHPGAQIGPGFCLVHSGGVAVGIPARVAKVRAITPEGRLIKGS